MAGGESTGAVVLAVVGNSFLTLLKFVAFGLSGSGAMLSEAIHSLADTGNQALLWLGIRRSESPGGPAFHYGMGAERFFFALMSAVGIFVLGCGVTVYHGVHMLLEPHVPEVGWLDFTVLGVSLVVDGFVLHKAVRVVNQRRGDTGFLHYVRSSSDPTLAAVLAEDGVACLGVLVALGGIALSHWTHSSLWDALATLAIGGMMGGIAIWLGWKNRTLLLGTAIPEDTQVEIARYLREQPAVEHVSVMRTRVVGAERFHVAAEVDWDGRVLGERMLHWVAAEVEDGHLADEAGRRSFCRAFGERMTESLAHEVDRIELDLRARFPELTYMEFEGQ